MRRNDPRTRNPLVRSPRISSQRRARLSLEALELRTLLTATGSLVGGLLTISGGAGNDDIDLLLSGGQLLLQDAGSTVQMFADAAVTSIEASGLGGNDSITIAAAVDQPATLNGGSGADVLQAGGGPSVLRGRGGNDTLIGGSASDVLRGLAGNDSMLGGPGNDRLVDTDGVADNDTVIGGAGLDRRTYQVAAGANNIENVDFGAPAPVPGIPFTPVSPAGSPTTALTPPVTLSAAEVDQLLSRASAATPSNDAIIAVVDRQGHILGVRVEAGVTGGSRDTAVFPTVDDYLVFAIDGAVAVARTGAFFASRGTPITSRTIQSLSETTMTQREIDSTPNIPDVNSPFRGPGFVAEIGLNGHFPPGVQFTPQVDLFGIEHTNRDGSVHPGADLVRGPNPNAGGANDDIPLPSRFNVPAQFIPLGQEIDAPDSYGFVSGVRPNAQGRGLGTLPGGVPILQDSNGDGIGDLIVGGIGVFFPGPNGYASFEQNFGGPGVQGINAPKVLEAEFMAVAAVDGLNGVLIPRGRIDLVGLQLEVIGPGGFYQGERTLREFGARLQAGAAPGTLVPSGTLRAVTPGLDGVAGTADDVFLTDGEIVPEQWLVTPHAGTGLSADDVMTIITQAFDEANLVRAAIRLPFSSTTRMVIGVADRDGNVLGLFRMPDSTIFSIDVAVSKARNTAYYADAGQVQDIDLVDDNRDGIPDLAAGVAFTNRTFRFLGLPFYPEGQDGLQPGAFSQLRDGVPGVNYDPFSLATLGAPQPASAFTSVVGFDAFNPGSNFREGQSPGVVIANQSGIVFFPGSTPLYLDINGDGIAAELVGGFGISGDGVDQDDVVTTFGAVGFLPPIQVTRADLVFVRGIRLPYLKFLRNPEGLS